MSALAHSQESHNNASMPHQAVDNSTTTAITSINVSARIDYIQRFSKQAVMVVDENAVVYSQVARQFLASLTKPKLKEHDQTEFNVAFVVASTKLNDIQMRCRIIEQLFSNTLFDPEQSLAVSIFRLAKQHNDVITIIIEHAHALSLQLKYELCQVVDVGNKTKNKIKVVFFAHEKAAQEVAQNSSIFNKKLSIISAASGQVINVESIKLASIGSIFNRKFWLILSLVILFITIALVTTWFVLTEHENFSWSKLPILASQKKSLPITGITSKETIVAKTTASIVHPNGDGASINDIQLAILGQLVPTSGNLAQTKKPAQVVDIFEALVFSEDKISKDSKKEITLLAENQVPSVTLAKTKISSLMVAITPNYFLNANSGFVIQISGFTEAKVLEDFIAENSDLELYSYERLLNNKPFVVVTSKIYLDKADANNAINTLSKVIQSRGPWVKSISEIKGEINTFVP